MIETDHPLVKLRRQAQELYVADPQPKRGRPYIYSERTIFQCLMLKVVKRLHNCNGLYTYLAHSANARIRETVGLTDTLPHPRTIVRRFDRVSAMFTKRKK